MNGVFLICIWIAEIVPLLATMFSFIFGLRYFFKKGKPLYLQCITMAMGCHSLSNVFHICQALTGYEVFEGFTPAYLGNIGFYLFFIVASYGHMDRIVDDGSKSMRPSRIMALLAPLTVVLLYIPNLIVNNVPVSTKITYALVWIPAAVSTYYNLKHFIMPNLDFGFIKAIKPYNFLAVCLGISELLLLTAWMYMSPALLVIFSILFATLSILTMLIARKGVEKWTI